jgi:predicted nucleic acid-binding protein
VVVSSRLAYPEVRAALAAARRSRRIETVGQREAKRTWEQFWSAVRVVELTEAVAGSAGQLAEDLALGGADAVHLASALVLGDTHVVMAAWDERLRAGAERAGLSTVPSPP